MTYKDKEQFVSAIMFYFSSAVLIGIWIGMVVSIVRFVCF